MNEHRQQKNGRCGEGRPCTGKNSLPARETDYLTNGAVGNDVRTTKKK